MQRDCVDSSVNVPCRGMQLQTTGDVERAGNVPFGRDGDLTPDKGRQLNITACFG